MTDLYLSFPCPPRTSSRAQNQTSVPGPRPVEPSAFDAFDLVQVGRPGAESLRQRVPRLARRLGSPALRRGRFWGRSAVAGGDVLVLQTVVLQTLRESKIVGERENCKMLMSVEEFKETDFCDGMMMHDGTYLLTCLPSSACVIILLVCRCCAAVSTSLTEQTSL